MSIIDSTLAGQISAQANTQSNTPDNSYSSNKNPQEGNFLSLLSISSVQITPDESTISSSIAQPPAPRQEPKGAQPQKKNDLSVQAQTPREPHANTAKNTDRPEQTSAPASKQQPQKTENNPTSENTRDVKATPLKAKETRETDDTVDNTAESDDIASLKAQQERIREALAEQFETIEQILAALVQAFSMRQFTQQQATSQASLSFNYQSITTTSISQFQSFAALNASGASQNSQAFGLQQTTVQQTFTSVQYQFQFAAQGQGNALWQGTQTGDTLSALQQLQTSLQDLRGALQASTESGVQAQTTSPAALFTAQFTKIQTTTITQTQTSSTAAPALNDASSLQARLQALLARLGASQQDNVQITARQVSGTENALNAQDDSKSQPLSLGHIFDVLKEGLQQVRQTIGAIQQEHVAQGAKFQDILPQADTVLDNVDNLEFAFKAQTISYAAKTEGGLPPFITSLGELENSLLGNGFSNQHSQFSSNAQHILASLGGQQQGNNGQQSGGQQGQPGQQLLGALNAPTGSTTSNNAKDASFSNTLSRSTPALINDQVQVQVKNAVRNGTSNIHIQLDPEELGKLDIRLTVEANGKTGVTVLADNRQTLELLQRDSAGLARALQDAGLSTDSGSLNFNLRGGEHQQSQSQDNGKSRHYHNQQPEEEDALTVLLNTNPTSDTNGDSGLDIRI